MVKTIYLDQMKWVDLARAETGHRLGEPYVETLEIFKRAADTGSARFVLSAAHYLETGRQHDRRRREDVAATMMRLAGMHRIAPPHIITPWEIRRALVAVFDLHQPVVDPRLFGRGVVHAFAEPRLGMGANLGVRQRLPEALRSRILRDSELGYEGMLLGGYTPDDVPDDLRLILDKMIRLSNDYLAAETRIAAWTKDAGRNRLEEIMHKIAVHDIIDPLVQAAEDLSIPFEQVLESDCVAKLIERMPSRWVHMQLRQFRHANPEKAWEMNDFNDILALGIAVPYCDVVVTEKSWSSMLNQAKVPQRYNTVVTPRLQDVVDLLKP